jgi:hypothetical protein
MAYDRLAVLKHMKEENERKEVLCQEIEEFWQDDCYGDVQDFFACNEMEYKLVASSLRSLEVEEVEAMRNDELAMMSALNLAMFAVQKNNFIPAGSDKCQATLDENIERAKND